MPNDLHHDEHPEIISRNARYGLVLFFLYLLLYGGFIVINVFYPRLMTETEFHYGNYEYSFGGLNLAIVYGVGLIFAAIGLSLVYMRWTRQRS